MTLNHGSLFSGGGGFDIAAELIGWENIFHCEWNEFCHTILQFYWPDAASYKNIKDFNAKEFQGHIDVLSGGFPCQPFSTAGKRRGTADDRYLWPEMLRIIRECQPKWVVGENVYGLVDWERGLVFDQVHLDLESQGYDVQAFVLPASGVNAPHRRYRVWFVACRNTSSGGAFINTFGERYGYEDRSPIRPESNRKGPSVKFAAGNRIKNWEEWPTQPLFCSGNDGLPDRLDRITFSKWRQESIKIYGNAIVPQVAVQIFSIIDLIEQQIGGK
jgi:DNA (cytosine-5)-methyltransferase 1